MLRLYNKNVINWSYFLELLSLYICETVQVGFHPPLC